MKYKIINILLATTVAACILSGCGREDILYVESSITTEDISHLESSIATEDISHTENSITTEESEETEALKIIEVTENEVVTDNTIVEDLPNTAEEKVDHLSANEEVVVIGKSDETISAETSSATGAVSSHEFLNYLNEQRKAAGLNELTWDRGAESNALARAITISENFSHSGASYNENIMFTSKASYIDWFNDWYASAEHRDNLMHERAISAACAYYYHDGIYYIAFEAVYKDATAEELTEMINSGEMKEVGTYIDENGATVTVYSTDGQ